MFTAKWDTDGGHDIVKLEGAQQEVRIMPVNGFNFYFWAFAGQQIMMETTTAPLCSTKHGTPILFPMPNRVRDAVYRWNGEEKTLTKRGEKVPCHGLVRDEAFTVTDMGADDEHAYCTACIRIAPGDGLYEGYPFACCLSVTYALSAQGVRMDAQITNEGMELIPFGLALHPYFTKRGDASRCWLKVPAKRYYETGEDLLPTGRLLPVGKGTTIHDDFHSVESLDLDNVYRGLTQDTPSYIRYEDLQIAISASDCFRNAVVFTPKSKPGFCIEPQTCSTDFMNLHARGLIDESGLLALPAHETFSCFVRFDVSRL